MRTLADIKGSVKAGQVYDVTSHYETRKDHPCYGTKRATVLRAGGTAFWLSLQAGPDQRKTWPPSDEQRVVWPQSHQVQQDPDGTIRLYGCGRGQEPGDLFMSLWPVTAEPAPATAGLAAQLGTKHGAEGAKPYGDVFSEAGQAALMTALDEAGPYTAENAMRRSDLLDAYREAYSWAAGTCFECGDHGAGQDVNGQLLCSHCASEYDAEVMQADVDALDKIAGLLRLRCLDEVTLDKIADVVRGTGRGDGIGLSARELAEAIDPPGLGLFTLDEDEVAAWLADGVTQYEGGPPAGHDPDDSLPDIGEEWDPAHDEEHDRTIRDLLFAARVAGLLICPAGWTLGYEYGDVNGDGFRWMLASTEEDRPLTLADAFNYTFPEGSGAVVAHRLLCEAVRAGNELLADLHRHATEIRRPAPPAQVWVLEHEHKYGTEFTAHATEARANAAAAAIARDNWDNIACLDGVPASPDGLDDQEAADIYFDNRAEEACHRYSLDVEGAEVAPLQVRAPEIAELVAKLPRGGWGSDELGTLADWLTDHGYGDGDAEDQDDDEPAAPVVLCDECWEAATGLHAVCEDGCNQDLDHDGLCVPGARPAVPWVEMRDEGQFWLVWPAAMKGPYPSGDAALADHYRCERCGDDTSRLHLLDAAEAASGDAHSVAPVMDDEQRAEWMAGLLAEGRRRAARPRGGV